MYLTGIGTAVPSERFTQAQCYEALQEAPPFWRLQPRSQALLKKVLGGENGIVSRHLALAKLADAFLLNPDALHARFLQHAPTLAADAAKAALAKARLTPNEVDAVIISTCTGYLCPGLTSYVSELLGLREEVIALDFVGQGCGAALPNWRAAEALLAAGRARHVLSVCVEICSAAFYLDDDPGVLVSACLFGDGAGATVFSAEPAAHARRVEWKAAASSLFPAERDLLRFAQQGGMLRNILTRDVPVLAGRRVAMLLTRMMGESSLQRSDVREWILHAGGTEVLLSLRKYLSLTEADVRLSAEVLREYGNVSSPCVIFVLEKALAQTTLGGWWWVSSFGAGFSCHGTFLKVD